MSLQATSELDALRAQVAARRGQGQRIGLVPTMGNLHAGHLALVEHLRASCDCLVASIFVNPTQFGPNEDFATYPRTLDDDLAALEEVGVDLVWTPSVDAMYPLEAPFLIKVPEVLSGTLCGPHRPGHFDGVASVVLRLFLQVQPDAAVFGEKDFQQLLVIRQLVRDYSLPIDIQALPTVREPDGLAMSSRNQYLSADERAVAGHLHRVLSATAERLLASDDWPALEARAIDALESVGFVPQYLAWRSATTLGPPEPGKAQRLLAAAQLGQARLIDNVPV
jgi:pantoate--beta-alanine ligase